MCDDIFGFASFDEQLLSIMTDKSQVIRFSLFFQDPMPVSILPTGVHSPERKACHFAAGVQIFAR